MAPRGKSKPRPTLAIGIDIGGTNVRCGLVRGDGEVVHWIEGSSEQGQEPKGMVALLVGLIEGVFKESGEGASAGELPIGIGVAGGIDANRGLVTQSPQFPKWKNLKLAERLSSALGGTAVFVRNDVDCALKGEHWKGAAAGADCVAAYWMGTGLGGALILDGKLVHGPSGMAGEFGHVMADPSGVECHCGAIGCLETIVSGWALGEQAARKAELGEPARLKDGSEALNASELAEAAKNNDRVAIEIWRRFGWHLGHGMGSLVNALSVDLILLGGKVSRASRYFLPEAKKQLKSRAFKYPGSRVRIVCARLGDQAGVIGAAAVALEGAGLNASRTLA